MMNDGKIAMDYFLDRIDDYYGKCSSEAKAIREELLSKDSIVIHSLSLSEISTIVNHENDDDIEDFFRQPKAASLMSACESDEESEVEDFGQWMAGLDGRQPVLDKLVIEWVDYWKIKESKSNKYMKRIINEAQLRQIVAEAVRRVLKEDTYDKDGFNKEGFNRNGLTKTETEMVKRFFKNAPRRGWEFFKSYANLPDDEEEQKKWYREWAWNMFMFKNRQNTPAGEDEDDGADNDFFWQLPYEDDDDFYIPAHSIMNR